MAIVIYVLTFLAGFVVVGGFATFASFNGASYFKDTEWGDVILLGLALFVSIVAGMIGGSTATLLVGIRRGDSSTAVKTVAVLLVLLSLAWVLQNTLQHQSVKSPEKRTMY